LIVIFTSLFPQAVHSKFNQTQARVIGSIPLLPLKTKYKGPAPQAQPNEEDIIDETLTTFKANILFRNFEVKGNADRLLIYLTLYASQCLRKIQGKNKADAEKTLYTLALENFPIPGDAKFVLGGMVSAPASRADADTLRQYLIQCRQELGSRLVQLVYKDPNKPDKWWMCWAKRKFLNLSLD
jgi:actin related protein 2/3 complex subunit 3